MYKILKTLLKNYSKILPLLFLFQGFFIQGQEATLYGVVLDENNIELSGAEILIDDSLKAVTDIDGSYLSTVPSGKEISVSISYPDKDKYVSRLSLETGEKKNLIVRLSSSDVSILTVRKRKDIGTQEINPQDYAYLPSLNGIEILSSVVDTYGELSSQYAVRGGNYDENLVYINGIEVYRPLLGRSGEQEGMSFLNPEMVENIIFSPGGWQAKYGDKMSSALDILYRKPKKFEASINASLIGGSITIGNKFILDEDKPRYKFLSALVSARYQNRNLILNTLDKNADFNPLYYDIQSIFSLSFSKRFSLDLIANMAHNRFELVPKSRTVRFGSFSQPIQVNVDYIGNENDSYQTEMLALAGTYKSGKNITLTGELFMNHDKEQEYFDILGNYAIQEVDPVTGNVTSTRNIASQLDHARNNLDYLIVGAQHRGKLELSKKTTSNDQIEWGIKYQNEDVRDLLNEWQLIDSAGYSLPALPFNPEGIPNNENLVLNYSTNAKSYLNSNRMSAYIQYQRNWVSKNKDDFSLLVGVRDSYWDYTQENTISPRIHFIYNPSWKVETDFWAASGFYYQPPFYKEIRNTAGELQKGTKSQRSIHFIVGNNFYFKMFQRKFKLTSEIYYKKLDNLIPYYLDNVRIRYTAENNSKGYIYGAEARLQGEIVEGAESWLRVSYTRAIENIDGRGNIPRPSDQRLRIALLYQDYMPKLPFMKANLRLVYASGLPTGAPFLSDPYNFQTYLSDYKRVDLGLTAMIIDPKNKEPKNGWTKYLKEFSVGVDVFNIFNINNTISNQFIRDINNDDIYVIPNRLTGRFFNVRLFIKV